jgi:hypothetical protein
LLLFDPRDRWRFLQKGWAIFFVAASAVSIGLRWWLGRGALERLTGGTRVGLLYGIAGAVLIIFAVLLAGLRYVPKWWWIGSRKSWLKGHIWLGSLSGVLVYCHTGGLHWGGSIEWMLSLTFALTLLTGVFGLVLQQVLPGRLTARVPTEVPYEQIPHVCRQMTSEADSLVHTAQSKPQLPSRTREQLNLFYDSVLRPFLLAGYSKIISATEHGSVENLFVTIQSLPGADLVQNELAKLQALARERLNLAEQERIQWWLHSWLYVHIPLSAAAVILLAAHAVIALRY